MSNGDEGIYFRTVPDSKLMRDFKMGRPKDTRFDAIVQKAFDEEEAQQAIIPEDQVHDVIRGIKRGARHLGGVSVSYTAIRSTDDPSQYVLEFIAYPTNRRGNTEADDTGELPVIDAVS